LEELECRLVPSTGWAGFAGNAQHTALAEAAAQPLQAIHWETPVDLNPQFDFGTLDLHYGEPVITRHNTVIVPVKTGAFDGFQLEAFDGATGAPEWTVSTDYVSPNPSLAAEYSPVLAGDRLYFAGAGGTLFYVSDLDAAGAHTPTRVAFYGTDNYNADPADFNNSVFVNTPLTADANGDVFFGIRVLGPNPQGLAGGIARVAPDGTGTFTTATAAANDPLVNFVPRDEAPALSNDGSTLYTVVFGGTNPALGKYDYLVALDSTTLQIKTDANGNPERRFLFDPRNGGTNPARIIGESSSLLVGPDGDVFYGEFGNPFNGSRGLLLHFSGDLSQEFAPGAFGFDETPSIVPASMVPSYHGTSSYLLMTKYNNYVSVEVGPSGGDGVNEIAILDPKATQLDTRNDGDPNLQVMREVLTIAGPTPDLFGQFFGFPDARTEWCINTAAVDPATDSVYVNNADGFLYQWDLGTNTLSRSVNLTAGAFEAYTPTAIGPDGTVYAINNAILFAVGRGAEQPPAASLSATKLDFGEQPVGTTSAAPRVTNLIVNAPNLHFVSVTASGPDAADFTLLNPPSVSPNTLGPMPLRFSFTPSHLGAESATFTIRTDQALLTVSLKGTGTPVGTGVSALSLSAARVNFGDVAPDSGATQVVTLTNLDSSGSVQLLGITGVGPDAADFPLRFAPQVGPLPGGALPLVFGFNPSRQGGEEAQYLIATSVGTFTVDLRGTGIASLSLSTAQLDFGSVPLATTLQALQATFFSRSTNVTFLGLTVSGPNAADFKLIDPSLLPAVGQTLGLGISVPLNFIFTPSVAGTESATVTIATSAGDLTLQLTGVGLSS
jgi:hypothetical protein